MDTSMLPHGMLPHGDCLHWNPYLIFMHATSDFVSFLACSIIAIVTYYVYHAGQLRDARRSYPSLWLLGAALLTTYGLSRLGAFLEIWYGGHFYWWTGANKVLLSVTLITFAIRFWHYRESIVLIGRVMASIENRQRRETAESVKSDSNDRNDSLSDTSMDLLISTSTSTPTSTSTSRSRSRSSIPPNHNLGDIEKE